MLPFGTRRTAAPAAECDAAPAAAVCAGTVECLVDRSRRPAGPHMAPSAGLAAAAVAVWAASAVLSVAPWSSVALAAVAPNLLVTGRDLFVAAAAAAVAAPESDTDSVGAAVDMLRLQLNHKKINLKIFFFFKVKFLKLVKC